MYIYAKLYDIKFTKAIKFSKIYKRATKIQKCAHL